MANTFNFSSENISIYEMVLDVSNSMSRGNIEKQVRKGIKRFIEKFETFVEAGSIVIALSKFGNDYYPEDFKNIKSLNTDYKSRNEATAVYYSIVEGSKHLMDYASEVAKRKNSKPKVTFILFSDGDPYNDKTSFSAAQEAITDLNFAGANTVFVPFGNAISSSFGERLGFTCIKKVDGEDDVVDFMERLSEAVKIQSRSNKALGANFFSQACNGASQGYSKATEQALEEDDWFENLL